VPRASVVPRIPPRKRNGTAVKVAIKATVTIVWPTPEKGVTRKPIARSRTLSPPAR